MNPVVFFRWLHIISGAAWLGEVFTINFVIIPSLRSMENDRRPGFIRSVFPRIFRLASFLSIVSISSGLTMSYLLSGWDDLSIFLTTRWGLAILIGGSLGIALTLFHFFVESRLEPIAFSLTNDTQSEEVERIISFLRYVPRAGLLVMIAIFLLMMYAARGV
jgi:uncharacterized membrane protein